MQRFALLGAGFIGSVHAASLAGNRRVDFVGVYDVDGDRARSLAGEHGTAVITDSEAAFDASRVDAVSLVQRFGEERAKGDTLACIEEVVSDRISSG